jgi:pyrroloquinoline quinone (PQQ) biosynthesis protein C
MAAGMVGGEALLPDFYMRIVPALRQYGFTDKELDIFIVHIQGDLEHAAEGRKLIRAYAASPEQRQRFYAIAKFARDRLWEAWDAVFQAADLDLPQAVRPKKLKKAA